MQTCEFCGRPTGSFAHAAGSAALSVPGDREPSPWERRGELGFLAGLVETTRAVCGRPREFFGGLRTDGGSIAPVAYGVIVGSLGAMGVLLLSFVMNRLEPRTRLDGTVASLGEDLFTLAFAAALVPVGLVAVILIEAGLTHLVLVMTGPQRGSFEATLRASCYSRGTWIFFAVPVLGCLGVPIWFVVVRIFAMMHLHEIGGGRASLAVLGPNVVCCVVSSLAQVAIFGLILAALSGTR